MLRLEHAQDKSCGTIPAHFEKSRFRSRTKRVVIQKLLTNAQAAVPGEGVRSNPAPGLVLSLSKGRRREQFVYQTTTPALAGGAREVVTTFCDYNSGGLILEKR